MNAPALKVTQYLQDLDDRTQPMTELQLRSIIKDCKRTLEQVSPYEAAPLYTAMTFAARRLGLNADSARYAHCAANLAPNDAYVKVNLAVALADTGKYFEAIDLFASLTGSDVPEYLILANMAECLQRVGLHDDAYSAFNDALVVADMANPQVLMTLAVQAALIDAQDAALELAARAVACCTNVRMGDLSPLEIIDSAPISLRQAIEEKQALHVAIERARMFAGIPRLARSSSEVIENRSSEELEIADREALALFEATKSLRRRANQAVLGEAEDA